MIKVNCPNCGVRLSAPEELIGKPVNCQKCNAKFILSRRWTSEPLVVADENPAVAGAFPEPGGKDTAATEMEHRSVRLLSQVDPANVNFSDAGQVSSAEPGLGTSFDFTLSAASLETSTLVNGEDPPTTLKSLPPANDPARRVFPAPVPASLPAYPSRPTAAEILPTTDLQQFRETSSIWQFFDFRFRGYMTPGIVRVSWFLILMTITFWLLFLSYFYLSSVIQRKEFALPTLETPSELENASVRPDGNVLIVPQFFVNSALFFTYAIASFVGLIWLRVLFEMVIMVFSIGAHLQGKQRQVNSKNSNR